MLGNNIDGLNNQEFKANSVTEIGNFPRILNGNPLSLILILAQNRN